MLRVAILHAILNSGILFQRHRLYEAHGKEYVVDKDATQSIHKTIIQSVKYNKTHNNGEYIKNMEMKLKKEIKSKYKKKKKITNKIVSKKKNISKMVTYKLKWIRIHNPLQWGNCDKNSTTTKRNSFAACEEMLCCWLLVNGMRKV